MKKYVKSYTNAYHGGNEWRDTHFTVKTKDELLCLRQYARNLGEWRVVITPKYLAKTDELVWQVEYFSRRLIGMDPASQGEVTESFETFYDAMDYVDSGEMAEMYL